jgi:quercetin dioxygenase-like cupin family protein
MLCRFFCAAVVVCLAVGVTAAQDPIKSEPKHYKLRFENDRVQVLDVHYGPHEKSEMHEHPAGVVVNVTAGHLKFTDQFGRVQDVYSNAGEARWFGPVKHKVENVGDEPFNAVYIGIKGKLATAVGDPKPNSPLSAEQLARLLADFAQPPAKP